jgi:hypothetical protein
MPLRAPRLAGFALLWLMSLDARQQFFFQKSPALPELLSLRLEIIEELDHLAVLVTKRAEARVCRQLSGARSLHPPRTLPTMIGCARPLRWSPSSRHEHNDRSLPPCSVRRFPGPRFDDFGLELDLSNLIDDFRIGQLSATTAPRMKCKYSEFAGTGIEGEWRCDQLQADRKLAGFLPALQTDVFEFGETKHEHAETAATLSGFGSATVCVSKARPW